MSFNIIEKLDDSVQPVNIRQDKTELLQAETIFLENFKGELSSVTGIYGKGFFIAKINELTCEVSNPQINIKSSNPIHITTSFRIIKGTYGKTWIKRTKIICNEEEQIEQEEIKEIKSEIKTTPNWGNIFKRK